MTYNVSSGTLNPTIRIQYKNLTIVAAAAAAGTTIKLL